MQRENGDPIDGFRLSDCPVIFGDKIEGTVTWKGGKSLNRLAGEPTRLRVRLRDAHLYSFRFAP